MIDVAAKFPDPKMYRKYNKPLTFDKEARGGTATCKSARFDTEPVKKPLTPF